VVPKLLAAAEQTIANCPCESGCPACVQQASCGNMNRPLDKAGAVKLLRWWLSSAGEIEQDVQDDGKDG